MTTTTAIVEYSETEAGLAELRSRISKVVYDVTTAVGMEAARKDRRECVKLRTSLDQLRLQLNADDQARIKLRNGRAKELESAIVALETPIDQQITAEEDRKEAEKQARINAEIARINTIRSKISAIGRAPVDAIGSTLPELQSIRASFASAKPAADEYQELLGEAINVWTRAGEQLDRLVDTAERMAAEDARQAAMRAELEELQRKQAIADKEAKDRRDREAEAWRLQQESEDLAAKALRDAVDKRAADERARVDAETRAAREAQEREEAAARAQREREDQEARERRAREDKEAADERARVDAEAKAARDAAARRLADECAEVERVAEANRKAEADRLEKAEKAETEKRRRHTEAVNARLSKFRAVPGGNDFIRAALDYRSAEQDAATERLVELCELYARRTAKAKVVGEAA